MPCFRDWSFARDLTQGPFASLVPEGSATGGSNLKFEIDVDKVLSNYITYMKKNYDDHNTYKVKKRDSKGKIVLDKKGKPVRISHTDLHFNYSASSFDLTKKNSLKFILEKINRDSTITDIRWAAYMLATVWHETKQSFLAVKENNGQPYGGHAYFNPYPTSTSPRYFGRGFIQLTWYDNYKKFDAYIPGLLANPDLAVALNPTTKQPDNAYAIMSIGMVQGLFTGKKLSDYINASKCDYDHARQIINSMDRHILIREVSESFEKLLKDCSK